MGKILIVAEKPAAGGDIAKVVGANKKGNGYLEGDKYVVTWAIGHLIGLKKPEEHDEKYKKWSMDTLPISFPLSESLKVLPETSKQFKIIKDLIHRDDIDMLINAGDAGREGYLIQEWIYRLAGCRLPKKVLWASSLTSAGIQKALNNLKENDLPEFRGILNEAEARAEGDYFLGMNYSRLLTLTRAYKQSLSYGRCQTPLLNLIGLRDEEIANFKSRSYWTIEVTYNKGFKGVYVDDTDKEVKFFDRLDADEAMKNLVNKGTVFLYEKQEKRVKAPLLYNLAKLQQDMGRKYGFSPDKTLEIAQALYEKYKIMSYPRSDSQCLSMDVYDEIAEHLKSCRFDKFEKLIDQIDLKNISADKSYFNDMKVTDHHALIPTINNEMATRYKELSEDERKVFDAVVISLIAIFYPEYRYDASKIIVDIGGKYFKSTGTTIKQLGFKSLIKDENQKEELQILPDMQQGDTISVDSAKLYEKKTIAPKKYNDETIIKVMEKYNIGTSATRADIIKKLQNPKRQFVVREKGKYSITDLGKAYIKVIPEKLKSPDLTQHFEEELQKVNAGEITKDVFLNHLMDTLKKDISQLTSAAISDDQKIGYSLQGNAEVLGKCPKCGSDIKTGKYGAYCTGKCGMSVGKAKGVSLSDSQVRNLLEGKKILIKALKNKEGKCYDAYFMMDGVEDYSFVNEDGKEIKGSKYKIKMEFPKKKN